MSSDIQSQKAVWRERFRAQARGISDAEWAAMSERACERLRAREEWRGARSILFYSPVRHELDVWPLLREALADDRLVALPRFSGGRDQYEAARIEVPERDLEVGRFGIREPRPVCVTVALNQLDLVLVPGVGFDRNGRRLGRGKGYYDRLLSTVRGVRCGVAAEWQVVPALPTLPHDEFVDCILTPGRWIACRQRPV